MAWPEDDRIRDNKHAICPHCGHRHADSWEWREGCHDVNCHSCDKPFVLSVTLTVTYTTWRG